jgi:hypothetical protein
VSPFSSDRFLTVRVVAFAACVPLIMRLPIDRVGWWVRPSGSRRPEPTREAVDALVASIDRSILRWRPLVRSGCVVRGMTLYRFLRLAGADVSLRFGIGVMDGDFAAHCWIVYRNEPLAEIRDPRPLFTETWAIAS